MIGVLVLLGAIPLAWFILRRPRSPPRTQLLLAASSLWMVDHFCISLRLVMREWPELKEVRLSVASLAALDAASIASLKGAIETSSSAKVRFRIDGYDVTMVRLLIASGISAEHFGSPRSASTYPRHLLH